MKRWLWPVWTATLVFCGGPSLWSQPVVSLREFLATVEITHPALRAASYEPDLAEAEIRNALGRFDPDLNLNYEYKDKDGSDKVNFLEGTLELPLNMLFGPKLKAEYRRGIGFQLDPERGTATAGEAAVGVSLPLFQGIFTDRRRTNLQKALQRPEAARAQYRIERNGLLRTAAKAYWNWSRAQAELVVNDTMVSLAEQRFQQVARQAAAGERPTIDSVEAAQEVQRRRGQRFDALRKMEQARVSVSVLLWGPDGQVQQLEGTPDRLPEQFGTVPVLPDAQQAALANRPEVKRLEVLQQLARLDSALAREFLRPYVELEAALISYNVDNIGATDYKMGVRVSQPLLFRSAAAGVQTADINVQRTDLSQLVVRRLVEADATNAVIAVERAQQRIQAASTEVELAQRMVAAERRLLEAGESTLLQVNLRERFLAEALLRLISAQADRAEADIDVLWATGTI